MIGKRLILGTKKTNAVKKHLLKPSHHFTGGFGA